MSTLSDRLRGLHGHSLPLNTLLDEAADELDRLTEEAADRYKSWCEMHSSFERGRDEIERLTARVAELEKMLQPPKQGMLSMSHCGCWKSQYIGEEAHEYKCPTHAALEHKHD